MRMRFCTLLRLMPVAGLLILLVACYYAPSATPLPEAPTATSLNIIMCTPPPCEPGERYYCPGECPGGCGTICATPTPEAQSPNETPGNIVMCTPPPCAAGEAYYCAGECPGGCGTTCATHTPAAAPSATPEFVIQCTPPPCAPDESYYCPGNCPGGCGTTCATRTPGPSGAGPVIDVFQAVPAEADPGDTVTLEWQSRGASRGALYHLFGGQLSTFWDVPPNGTMTYTIPSTMRNSDSLLLFAIDDAGRNTSAMLTITLRCPDAWFFSPPPSECAGGPATSGLAAQQTFEHGTMLWVGNEARIYIVFDGGRQPAWAAYWDEWSEGDPVSDPAIVPPAGLYQPVRGFGLVWRTQPGVRDGLGWAAGEETGFTGSMQRTGRIKYNLTYLSALDGGVWELGPEGSAWRHIP